MKKSYRVRVGTVDVDVTVEGAAGAFLVSLGGSTHRVDVVEVLPERYSLVVDGRSHVVAAHVRDAGPVPGAARRPDLAGGNPVTLVIDGESHRVQVGRPAPAGSAAPGRSAQRTGEVRAPMPGLVVAVGAGEGAAVASGQPLIIMEAMKMQMEIRAPHAGTVRRVHVTAGQEVAGNQLLVTMV